MGANASTSQNSQCLPTLYPRFLKPYEGSSSTATYPLILATIPNKKQRDIRLDYVFHRQLGEGRFGKVRRSIRKHDNFRVAVKSILKKEIKPSETHLLRQEVRALQVLSHPNIVQLIDLYESSTHVHIVMELCGDELLDRILKVGHLSEVMCADIMHQILSAVSCMHAKGIVHRDLKPENILFKTEESWTIKVCDFGLSKFYANSSEEKMDQRLGTVFYMSPEVLQQNYTNKCDVWSVGVIMYIILCGYPPFAGRSDNEIYHSILTSTRVEFEEEKWSNISQEAKDFIVQLLNRNEQERLSANEALQNKWLLGDASGTRQVTTRALESLSQFCAMNKFKRAAIGHLSLLLSQEEISSLEQEFRSIDVDLDGFITSKELADAISRTRSNSAVSFELLDIDGNGKLDLQEFLRAAVSRKEYLREQRLAQTFSWFDEDKNGTISVGELRRVLPGLTDAEVTDLVRTVDLNGDDEIDLNEFRQAMLRALEGGNGGPLAGLQYSQQQQPIALV